VHRQQVPSAEEILKDYQCGFREGGQLLMLRYVCEKFHELNIDLHVLFIDFKKASDSVYLYKI
jgi:hypothetical protein